METANLIQQWYSLWESGNFKTLPITNSFEHTSPYGTITGKKDYLALAEANQDKFLGNTFNIHQTLIEKETACVRYTMHGRNFDMEVTEWFFMKNQLIDRVIAYYNIEGEINEDRKLNQL
jgi:hypothetical protein